MKGKFYSAKCLCSAYNGTKLKTEDRGFMETRRHVEEVLPELIAAGAAVGIQGDTKLNSAAILLDAGSTEIRKVAKMVESP